MQNDKNDTRKYKTITWTRLSHRYDITATMDSGTVYPYTVSDIAIYEKTAGLSLPVMNGKTLVLVTCYPFRYSGHAPGKCVVTAMQNPWVYKSLQKDYSFDRPASLAFSVVMIQYINVYAAALQNHKHHAEGKT